MELMIRKATPRDYEALCALYAEVDALHRDAVPSVFRVPNSSPRTREFVSGIIADENAALLVAESKGKVIAFLCVRIRQAPDIPILTPRRFARIEEIVVSKAFQRHGVGQALLDKAHRWALERQVRQVELTVWEFNKAAIAFYERQGYTIAHRTMWRTLQHKAPSERRP
jgi:ribosomal protein S18 acetylase RimI-like enzyme